MTLPARVIPSAPRPLLTMAMAVPRCLLIAAGFRMKPAAALSFRPARIHCKTLLRISRPTVDNNISAPAPVYFSSPYTFIRAYRSPAAVVVVVVWSFLCLCTVHKRSVSQKHRETAAPPSPLLVHRLVLFYILHNNTRACLGFQGFRCSALPFPPFEILTILVQKYCLIFVHDLSLILGTNTFARVIYNIIIHCRSD